MFIVELLAFFFFFWGGGGGTLFYYFYARILIFAIMFTPCLLLKKIWFVCEVRMLDECWVRFSQTRKRQVPHKEPP